MTQAAPPTCLITRPEPEASRFAERIRAELGLTTVVNPMMRYAYPDLSIEIDTYAGVILTSSAALQVLDAADPDRKQHVYAVGAKTGAAAAALGFQVTTGPGDAAGLIDMILRENTQGPLIHLRGQHTRGDVAQLLTESGVKTEEVIVYQQLECDLSDQARRLLSGEAPVILPLFSPRSADIFARSAPFAAPVHVVAMSNAVAQSAAGFATAAIRVADTPDAAAMLDAVKDVAAQQSAG